MSGQLGCELKKAMGTEASNYEDLICALDKKIVGIQVNCNGNYRYHHRKDITSERDTCLRMLCSYYFKYCAPENWEKYYKAMCHLMPFEMERIIELILMDWEEQTQTQTQTACPFFFICFDESSKVEGLVHEYVSKRNILIDHFEHANLSDGLSDLRKIKIINLVTALDPNEIAKESELNKTKASDRKIKWICLPDLRWYLDELVPKSITDSEMKFYYKLGLYWTNGNPRLVEKMLRMLKSQTCLGQFSKRQFMSTIECVSYEELKVTDQYAWKFVALVVCRFAVQANFNVTHSYNVKDLFLQSFYTSDPPFPLVELCLPRKVVDECITSKLYLQSYVSNKPPGRENKQIIKYMGALLDLESELKEEMWDPYVANLFALHLSCWMFILLNPEPFAPLLSLTDKRANINLRRAVGEGVLSLAQLFHVVPKTCVGSRKLDSVMINLKQLMDHGINWTIVDDFIPRVTKLDPGTIYLPKSKRNPGWDVCICFWEGNTLSVLFIQSKDMQDGSESKISP